MKKKLCMILMMILTMMFTGFEKERKELGDTFVLGQDYQYMLEASGDFLQKQARGEKGYFFINGNYVYYLDDATKTLISLCNKVDCLHDNEGNSDKQKECNAYFDNTFDIGLGYCDGYLYTFSSGFDGDFLYRLKEDGSQKEVVYEWEDENVNVNDWIIHRGYMFYVEQTFKKDEGSDESEEIYCVKKLELDKVGNAPKLVYEAEQGKTALLLDYLMAYGNYVYFQNTGSITSDRDFTLGEDWLDYTYMTNTIKEKGKQRKSFSFLLTKVSI